MILHPTALAAWHDEQARALGIDAPPGTVRVGPDYGETTEQTLEEES